MLTFLKITLIQVISLPLTFSETWRWRTEVSPRTRNSCRTTKHNNQ